MTRPATRPRPRQRRDEVGVDQPLDQPIDQPLDPPRAVPPAVEDSEADRPGRRELRAVNHEWEWQLAGSCRDVDPELFFHPWGERDPSRSRREVAAKAVCATCPVLRQCRAYALETREPYGVWGGLSEHDREDILGIRFG